MSSLGISSSIGRSEVDTAGLAFQRARNAAILSYAQELNIQSRFEEAKFKAREPKGRYNYPPLDNNKGSDPIRLISLLPGDSSQVIYCRIELATLQDCPRYEALSYQWGDSESKHAIVLRNEAGEEWNHPVTDNLFAALQRLRRLKISRILWVDAICINQQDDAEKNIQVAMMREIYKKSFRTLIWLGEESDNSHNALPLVELINDVRKNVTAEGIRPGTWTLEWEGHGLPSQNHTIWYDLFKVLKRPWFGRAWIVQELAVSPRVSVLCGDITFEWDTLVQVMKYLVDSDNFSVQFGAIGLNALLELDLQRERFQQKEDAEVFRVLLQNRRAHATDPRDKVFAFHGLFNRGSLGHSITMPKYEKECFDIYTDVAIEFIKHRRNLDIFSIPRVLETSDDKEGKEIDVPDDRAGYLKDLPTWIPNWSVNDLTESLLWRQLTPGFLPEAVANYRASGDSTYDFQPEYLNADGTKLKVEGWVIDEACKISLVMDQLPDEIPSYNYSMLAKAIIRSQQVQASWNAVVYDPFTMLSKYPTGESWRDAYRNTLLGGCAFANDPAIAHLFLANEIKSLPFRVLQTLCLDRVWFIKLILYFLTLTSWIVERFKYISWDPPSGSLFSMSVLMSQVGNRVVIKTFKGLIGLAPRMAGDGIIFLIKGAKFPILLKPSSEDPKNCTWEVVGDCYIHGLMDGKLWDMLEGNCKPSGEIWDIYQNSLRAELWLS